MTSFVNKVDERMAQVWDLLTSIMERISFINAVTPWYDWVSGHFIIGLLIIISIL